MATILLKRFLTMDFAIRFNLSDEDRADENCFLNLFRKNKKMNL
jgi:hypothetical protein